MSKTQQRYKTHLKQGFEDGKSAETGILWSKYYKNNPVSRFYKSVAPYGYAEGWYSGIKAK